MERLENGDSLSWHYLDSVQKEFGPFAQATMREWFNQGFFPNGEELMIRLPHWKHHLALKMVWPDVSQAFMGMPKLSPPSSLPQVAAREGFDQYPTADLQFGGGRSAEEPSYLGEALQRGGFWGGQADPSAISSSISSGLMGYPAHGMSSLPGTENAIAAACGMPIPGATNELLERMPHMSGVLPNLGNPAIQSDLAGMGHLVAMSGLGGMHSMPGMSGLMLPDNQQTDAMSQGIDGQYGFAGIMMPMQQAALNQQLGHVGTMAPHLPTQMPGYRPAGRFRGRIKSFNAKQGFGFIENPEAYAMFGRDVFLHKAQIGNLKVGMEVTYGVEMNKFGMPQARELATLDGKPPGPPPASVAKGGTKTKPAGKNLAKRLFKNKEQAEDVTAATPGLNLFKVPDLKHAAVSLQQS